MHTYRPPKISRADIIVPVILILICSTCFWAANTAPIIPPFIMQLLAVASATAAIQIITRYSLTSFMYETNDESSSFKVTKYTGRKNTLVADIEYTDILHIDKKEKGYSLKKKYSKSFRTYNFCNNILPLSRYCLVCDVGGNNIAIIIEADDTFLKALNSKLSDNTASQNISKEDQQ